MSYVRKLGVSALVITAAFAVAFAVLISSTTQTVEARIQDTAAGTGTDTSATKNNGDTVYILNSEADAYVRFELSTTGAAAASFTHADASDDGQSILCQASTATGACDVDDGAGVTVALKIDDDSGKGVIFVKQTTIPATGAPVVTTDTITVQVAQVPTKISVKPAAKSINAGQGNDSPTGTNIDIQLTDSNGKGIAGKRLTIVASRGVLREVIADGTATGEPQPDSGNNSRDIDGDSTTDNALTFTAEAGTLPDSTRAQAGSVVTTADTSVTPGTDDGVDSAGYARVWLQGGGSPGVATITVTIGEVSGTATVVLHGAAKTVTADPEHGAIEQGGKTFIVVTVTDSAGNAVANYNVDRKSGASGIVGPAKAATEVTTSNLVNKDVNSNNKFDKGDIPACGDITGVPDDPSTTDEDETVLGSTGTNGDGQCVIQVDAGSATGTADDAARGTHMITIVGPKADGSANVTVEIQVGGPPAEIDHDAPARIDTSDEITVNLTVLDDEGVRVGRVAIEVIKTAGDGAIIVDAAEMTSDGKAKFTYLAPSTPGTVEFLARTKAGTKVTAKQPIIIQIGEEEAPVEPPTPSLNKTPASTGYTIVTFSGGSIDELVAAVTASCGPSASIYTTNLGSYVAYHVGALAIANRAFNDLYADGIPANEGFLVGGCS